MKIDAITAHPNGVVECLGPDQVTACLDANMLFQDGEFGLDAAAFADIDVLGQPIGSAYYVRTQA